MDNKRLVAASGQAAVDRLRPHAPGGPRSAWGHDDATPPPPRERLRAEGRHDSTFSSTPMEMAVTIDALLARLPGPAGS
jgi:hypothetical protein